MASGGRLAGGHGEVVTLRDAALVQIMGTAGVHQRQFDTWREVVYQTCGALCTVNERGGTFGGTMVNVGLGSIQAILVQANPHTVARTERQIRRSVTERLYLCMPLDGNVWLIQDNRRSTVGSGELMVFENTRAYSLTMLEPIRMMILTFPHQAVNVTPGVTRQLMVRRWSGKEGLSALLSHMIVGLERHLTELSLVTAEELGRSIASITSSLLAERLNVAVTDPTATRHALMMRIQAFARSQLGNPQLDPGVLANRHNVSLRYLQHLFHEQGVSPARWIRYERLARCAEDLQNPSFAHLTVAMIGERRGLPSAPHFSRLFRERYGVTPREFRRNRQLDAGMKEISTSSASAPVDKTSCR